MSKKQLYTFITIIYISRTKLIVLKLVATSQNKWTELNSEPYLSTSWTQLNNLVKLYYTMTHWEFVQLDINYCTYVVCRKLDNLFLCTHKSNIEKLGIRTVTYTKKKYSTTNYLERNYIPSLTIIVRDINFDLIGFKGHSTD